MTEPAKFILTIGTEKPAENPAVGKLAFYPKSDGWYSLDSSGVETKMFNESLVAQEITFDPASTSVVTGTEVQTAIEELDQELSTFSGVPYLEVIATGEQQGLVCTEKFSVGLPDAPDCVSIGGGAHYPVGMENTYPTGPPSVGSAWHCTMTNTSGLTITGATDITSILSSETGSTTGLFNGESVGNYILVGSDVQYQGVGVKIDTLGIVEPDNIVGEFLINSTPEWYEIEKMVSDCEYPFEHRANNIATKAGKEHWRFGSDPRDLPLTWCKCTMTINGVGYTKYWARLRITSLITLDPVIEMLRLHTNSLVIDGTGNQQYFGLARKKKTLQSGVTMLVANEVNSPSNESVDYESGECSARYIDNELVNGAVDTTLVVQNIETGIDTSIPLLLEINYYVNVNTAGDIEWELDIYHISDGFSYDGTATPSTSQQLIDSVPVNQAFVRRRISLVVPIYELTDADSIIIKIKRDASSANLDDTLAGNVVITNVRLSGFFWR